MLRLALMTFILLAAACGDPTPSNNAGTDAGVNNAGVDASNNVSVNSSTNQTTAGTECGAIGERFIAAVRAMGRECFTDADCKIASRGQVCDCELAVTAGADTTEFDATRAELDAAQCANPFGCVAGTCPYRKLSEPGELFAHCGDAGECEIVQLTPCAEFEANATGGLVPSGGCADDTQCSRRTDLNPCGCAESISGNFPFLAVQATAEMMSINRSRCNLDCQGCPAPGTPACGDDGAGNMVCVSN